MKRGKCGMKGRRVPLLKWVDVCGSPRLVRADTVRVTRYTVPRLIRAEGSQETGQSARNGEKKLRKLSLRLIKMNLLDS
jgi:hypothetical protein